MEIRNLKTFIVIAEKMNFSKAAEELGYTQAAVSIQIKQLEKELDTPLFDRLGKHIYLTDKGKEFLERAQKIIRYTEDSLSLMKEVETASSIIRIGTSESLLSAILPDIIVKFNQIYPDVQLKIRTDIRDSIFNALKHNDIDFAYTFDLNLIDHQWVGRTVHEDKIYFVASPQNHLAKKDDINLSDVLNENLAITETNVGYSYALYQLLSKQDIYPKPFLETGNTDLLKQLVINNQAISYLPLYAIQEEIDSGLIVPIRLPKYEVTVYQQLYWHKNKYLTKPMIDFMALIDGSFT